jgi:hypothetical protein
VTGAERLRFGACVLLKTSALYSGEQIANDIEARLILQNGAAMSRLITCFPATEGDIELIVGRLKQIGLFDRYDEHVFGERVQVSVQTRNFAEREAVKAVLQDAGISEFFYTDEGAA